MHFKFSRLAALTLAGCALLAPTTHAAQPYNDGDILLAVRTSTDAVSYLYNLGPAAGFLDSSSQLTLQLNMQSDLTTIFGASWSTRSDLFWSITGVQKFGSDETGAVANSMYISTKHTGELVPGVKSSNAFQSFGVTGGANAPALKLQLMGGRYREGSDAIGTLAEESSANDFGLRQPNNEPNSYRSFTPGGANTVGSSFFGVFTANGGIENNFAGGPSLAALDWYEIVPGGGTPQYEGSFSVDSNAVVTFTPEGVPEPASAAVLAAGAMVLGFVRRRRAAAAH